MPCPIPVGARLARECDGSADNNVECQDAFAGKPRSYRVIHKLLEILAQPQRVVDRRVHVTLGHAVADAEQQVAVTALLKAWLRLDREQGFDVDLAFVARALLHRVVDFLVRAHAVFDDHLVHHPLLLGAGVFAVSYTHLRAHETDSYLVCRLLLEKNFF